MVENLLLPPPAATPATPPHDRKKQKKVMIIITLIFLILGVAVLIWWLIWGQFRESTTDAYVNGNMVQINSQIVGNVTTIYVDNTDLVEENQVIVELDRTDTQISFDKSKAELADTLRMVSKMFAQVKEFEAQIDMKQAELIRTMQDFEHREPLVEVGGVSKEDYEHAEARLKEAMAALFYTQYQYLAACAQVQNTTILDHPQVEQAKENLRSAWVNLQRCRIVAPVKGIIAMRRAQVGESISPATPLLAIIPLDQIWVDANFKEVQLSHVRIGQPVHMKADMYGGEVIYHGKVVGLEAGTGSVFSVLPPQNATGNWIKIVQRLPVRIALEPEQIEKHPLMLGLSMDVTVDTHQREGRMIPCPTPEAPLYLTDIFSSQIQGAEEAIAQIINDNVDLHILEELSGPTTNPEK